MRVIKHLLCATQTPHVGCQTTDPTTAPTQYTTTSPPVDTTASDLDDPRPQGDNNIIFIGN